MDADRGFLIHGKRGGRLKKEGKKYKCENNESRGRYMRKQNWLKWNGK